MLICYTNPRDLNKMQTDSAGPRGDKPPGNGMLSLQGLHFRRQGTQPHLSGFAPLSSGFLLIIFLCY